MKRIAIFVVAIAVAALSIVAPAMAQSATISAGPLFDAAQPFISAALDAVIVVAIGWGATLLQRWTGIQIESRHREALHSAAMTGVTQVLSVLGGRADTLTAAVKSQVVAEAAGWVAESVPDAVRYLGATPDKIAAIVSAKLGQIIAGTK